MNSGSFKGLSWGRTWTELLNGNQPEHSASTAGHAVGVRERLHINLKDCYRLAVG